MKDFALSVVREYTSRGFTVRDVHADSEFACIEQDLHPTKLDLVTTNGHAPEVERSIRTIKENLRSTVHGLPFKRLPKLMVQHLVRYVNRNLNQLPRPKGGLLQHTSPEAIVTGRARPDYNQLDIEFGSYVQIFDATTNTVGARTLGAIALDRTGYADGSYYFLSLKTGRLLSKTPSLCTVLPITDIAIRRLEQLAKNEDQPLIQSSNLLVEWRPDQLFDEDEYDADYDSDDDLSIDDDEYNIADEPISPDELSGLLDDLDAEPLLVPFPPTGTPALPEALVFNEVDVSVASDADPVPDDFGEVGADDDPVFDEPIPVDFGEVGAGENVTFEEAGAGDDPPVVEVPTAQFEDVGAPADTVLTDSISSVRQGYTYNLRGLNLESVVRLPPLLPRAFSTLTPIPLCFPRSTLLFFTAL
jgi:hypothetical protein